jgi:hypothetical protein
MRRVLVMGILLGLLVLAGTASALRSIERVTLRAGDLVVHGHGGFRPEALPRDHDAPITVEGGGRITTISGELPPTLDEINFEFDRHGSVDTTGLPVCTKAQLVATDTAAARRACGGAIVGKGFARVVVSFPEQPPIPVSSPITIFNGPKKHGDDTVLAHSYIGVPSPSAIVIPVVIEKIHNGIYGYRTETKIPRLVNGYGHPVSGSLRISRKWTYKGARHSYANARCANGRLQAHGEFSFADGTVLSGTFLRRCTVRG